MSNYYTIDTTGIAELLGYARNYISELVNDHGMPKVDHNKFDLQAVIPWHIQHLKKLHDNELEKLKASKPQDDLARKQAKLKQMDIDEREGKVIDSDLVRMKWLDEIKIFDTNISSIESSLIIDLKLILKDVEKGNEIIRKTITKIKEKIATTELNI